MAFGFGKKKEAPAEAPSGFEMPPLEPVQPSGLPADQVMSLRQQGFTDNQIITALQRDGYTVDQIYSALNQAGMQAAGPIGQEPQMEAPAMPQAPQMPPPMAAPPMGGYRDEEKTEEIAERIISEKWEEFTKEMAKITEWKDKTETTVTKMQQELEDLKSTVDNLHKAIIGKIEEYDQNLTNVGTEIKAMEKVFQKILPTFTENVNELSRITQGIKRKSA